MQAKFFWQIGEAEIPGPIISKPTIIAQDAGGYALPEGASSGVLRVVDGGPEYQVPGPAVPTIREVFGGAVESARELILDLKAAAWQAQVAQGVDPGTATANGVVFAAYHATAISNYELAGGHPLAAAALLDAVEADTIHEFLQLPGVMAVFQAALAPE